MLFLDIESLKTRVFCWNIAEKNTFHCSLSVFHWLKFPFQRSNCCGISFLGFSAKNFLRLTFKKKLLKWKYPDEINKFPDFLKIYIFIRYPRLDRICSNKIHQKFHSQKFSFMRYSMWPFQKQCENTILWGKLSKLNYFWIYQLDFYWRITEEL